MNQRYGRLGELRARRALVAAGINAAGVPLTRLESVTNEVWATPDLVVRVNRTASGRLRRESMIFETLPPDVGYPQVLATGNDGSHDWLVARRRPGAPLIDSWPQMDLDARREAIAQIARMLRALHGTAAPPDLPFLNDPPQPLVLGPRATEPVLAAAERVLTLPLIDAGLIGDAIAFVTANRKVLDPFESATYIHGDLHFQNVLWEREVTALLDLEFARPAPPDLDLDVFLRFCFFPALFVPPGKEHLAHAADYGEVPFWLAEEAPWLFDRPQLVDRLRIYAIAFEFRQVLRNPPTSNESTLMRDHPYRRLGDLVRQKSYLDTLASR